MSTNTYVALRTETVTVATASVTLDLTGITGYTDLRISGIAQAAVTANNIYIRFNGDTGNNYSMIYMYGSGSAATSGKTSTTNSIYASGLGLTPTLLNMDIFNYANTTTYKACLQRGSAPDGTVATTGMWRGSTGSATQAITSITLLTDTTFAVGTTFSLYGIKAFAPETTTKATGGYVYSDSTHWYHAFPYSGTFTPNQSLTADILAIAGGGSGGANVGGGGGAGGILGFASQSLTATGYTVTVGAGGGGVASNNLRGTSGSNSQFGGLTAVVGGGGGGSLGTVQRDGSNGGSGGGGGTGFDLGTAGNGGSASPSGQGNAGGAGQSGSNGQYLASGGGGGAGTAGTAGTGLGQTGVGGKGGDGVNTLPSSIGSLAAWCSATGFGDGGYFAGGGGGTVGEANDFGTPGNGGLGGGGFGGTYKFRNAGTGLQHTGSGGGGGANGTNNGQGASGIVIVRYLKA